MQSSNRTPSHLPKWAQNMGRQKPTTCVYSSFSHNCQTGRNQDVRKMLNGETNCGTCTQWNIIQWFKKWPIKTQKDMEEAKMKILVKEASLKGQYSVWGQLYDILERATVCRQQKKKKKIGGCQKLGRWGRKGLDRGSTGIFTAVKLLGMTL